MSTEPSQSSSEPERKPLKPGKGYGIAASLCGIGVWFVLVACFFPTLLFYVGLIAEPSVEGLWAIWYMYFIALLYLSPFCAIAGIVCGILGRNTYERSYAYIGLVLSALYALLGFSITAYALLVACF